MKSSSKYSYSSIMFGEDPDTFFHGKDPDPVFFKTGSAKLLLRLQSAICISLSRIFDLRVASDTDLPDIRLNTYIFFLIIKGIYLF